MKIKRVEYDPYSGNFTATFKCHSCEKPVPFDANYCPHCGAELYRKKPSVLHLTRGEMCAILYTAIDFGWINVREKLHEGIHEKDESGGGDGFCYYEKPNDKAEE